MSFSLQLKGVSTLERQLLELGNELALKTLAAAARKAMKPVLATAKSLVPVLSGDLREALHLSVVKPSGGETFVAVGITVSAKSARGEAIKAAVKRKLGKDVAAKGLRFKKVRVSHSSVNELPPAVRWRFIELGTVKMPAHPFLRPALDQNTSGVLAALKEELAQGIARALKKGGK